MKKRRFLAALLVTTMALSTMVSASSNSPTDVNADDNLNGNNFSQGYNSYEDGYFYLVLPGDLAFTIDPARQKSTLQVTGGDYNIKNLGRAATEVEVFPSVAAGGDQTWNQWGYSLVTGGNPSLVTGSVWNKANGYTAVSASAYADNLITTKKGLYLTVIPADGGITATGDALTHDINGDGTFEFDYTAQANQVGVSKLATRQAFDVEKDLGTVEGENGDFVYLREPFKGASTVSGRSVVVQKVMSAAALTEAGETGDFNYKDFVTGESLKFFLPSAASGSAIKTDELGLIGYTNAITSFTVAGAVNPDSVYEPGSIIFQTVYKITSATPDKQNKYKAVTGKACLVE